MEKNFTIKFRANGNRYEALVIHVETSAESWYRVEYKNENAAGNVQIAEIVFDPALNNDEPVGWSLRDGGSGFNKQLTKEFLNAAGKEIENHVELFE